MLAPQSIATAIAETIEAAKVSLLPIAIRTTLPKLIAVIPSGGPRRDLPHEGLQKPGTADGLACRPHHTARRASPAAEVLRPIVTVYWAASGDLVADSSVLAKIGRQGETRKGKAKEQGSRVPRENRRDRTVARPSNRFIRGHPSSSLLTRSMISSWLSSSPTGRMT